MNLSQFYNPKKVYEGYFESYFIRPFFHHYADFRGPESIKSCLISLAAWLFVTIGIIGILMGQVGLLGPEVGFTFLSVGCIIWAAISLVPIAALIARTLNSHSDFTIKSRFLGIDSMLAISCFLFFILGLLMMTTTLNSGSLDPNASISDLEDSSHNFIQEIKEEPIFTYQDEEPAVPEIASDSLNEIAEPDMLTPEESFDPTITQPDEILLQSQDSLQ